MANHGTGKIGLGLALAMCSCLRASVPEFPSHLTTTLKLSERPTGPHGQAPFAVVAAGPHGEVGTEQDPGVTLVFNRPMRKLDAPETQGVEVPFATLKNAAGEAVGGAFRWVGTHGVLFEPKGKLPGATRFEARIAAGTTALDGSRLAKDYVLEFATERPRLVEMRPAAGTEVDVKAPIFLRFSQAIARDEVLRHLTFTRRTETSPQGEPVPFTLGAEAPGGVSNTARWVRVVPNAALPRASNFDLTLSAGLHGGEGPLTSEKPSTWSFQTYGPLRISNVHCAQQSLGRCQAHRDFSVVTTTPVAVAEFRKHLKIEGPKRPARPNPKEKRKPVPGTQHPLQLDPDYGDRFTVTLDADLTDTYGQRLGSEAKFELAVEAPFVTPNKKAVPGASSDAQKRRNAYRDDSGEPPPNVPRRQTLFQDLELGVRGQVLEALAGAGGKEGNARHQIPVGSVNLATYGLRSWSSSEMATLHWFGQGSDSEQWRRPPGWNWFTPGGPANERAVQLLDLDAVLGVNAHGAAFVEAIALGEDNPRSQLLSVTDLGLSARISRFGSLVWVTHLSSGAPAADANVSIYDGTGNVLLTRTTDAQGLVDFAASELEPLNEQGGHKQDLVFVARLGNDWTFQRVQPSSAISTGTWVDTEQKGKWVGLVFAERGVYRPGETLHAGGYFRKTTARELIVPKQREFEYTLTDLNGETIGQGRGELDAFGAVSLSVELAKSAALGPAELRVRFGRGYDESFTTQFQLLDYKPAEFKVAVEAVNAEVIFGTAADFRIHSEYLFGAPVAGGRVNQYLSSVATTFEPPNSDGLILDDSAYRRDLRSTYEGTDYANDTTELDEQGKGDFHWELHGTPRQTPQRLMLEAEVQDLTQQTQSGRASVLVHPAAFYLGLQQPKQRFLAIGAKLAPAIVALDPKGNAVAGVPVRVELFRRSWTTAVEDRASDSLYYQTRVHDEPAGECSITTQARAQSCALRLAEPGYYIARATAKDRLGNPVASSLALYAVDDRADASATVGWSEPDRRGLQLEFDRASYAPGDVAKLLVKNPFKAGSALVTVERGSILLRKVVELKGPMPLVEIPVDDAFFPNAYVSVHLIRGRTARQVPLENAQQADVGAPQFRVGYAELQVATESRKLDVAVSTAAPKYGPGDEVQAQVRLKDRDGKPASGSVTFYVVDDGVLLLTGYQTPNPLPAFSGTRSLGVFPIESRENLARIIALRPGEHFDPLGWETPPRDQYQEYDSDKGDEVGDGEEARLRADFRTTVFFEAGHPVGADGLAEFHFKLPDNLTSFRLMAVAAGDQDRFGYGQHTITSSRPLMARPLLPRILRVGDQFQAGVAVTSLGLAAGPANVTLKPTGVTLGSANALTVNLPASGQAEARFPISVTRAGEVAFEFAATHKGGKDRVRLTRKVTQPVRWLNAASYGATKDSVAIGLGDLRGVRPDLGELEVTLSSSALVGLDKVFENLIDYPYGCTEQLSSRILPMLSAAQLAAQQNVRVPSGRIDWVDEAVGQIASRQRYDGTFGYWDGDSTNVPWLTAYALLALERASQQGYFVPRAVRDQAVERAREDLTEMVNAAQAGREAKTKAKKDSAPPAEPKQLGLHQRSPGEELQVELAQAAFIADVLSSIGQPPKAQLFELASLHDEMSISIRAQLLHAMAKARLPRQDLNRLLAEVLSETTVGPYEARVDVVNEALAELFESPARTTAWVLRAVLAVDPKHVAATKLARGLVGMRQHEAYRNTQEDAWVLIALEEYRQACEDTAPNFSAKVALDGEVRGEFAFRGLPVHSEHTTIPMKDLLAAESKTLGLFAEGEGAMYYAVTLKAAKDGVSAHAMDEGLSIDKRMRGLEPSELSEAGGVIPKRTELRAGLGQLVMVDLLLESAEPRDQLVIDDPLPAGLEPVDFGFETTARALSSMSDQEAKLVEKPLPVTARWGQIGNMQAVHREMHDDRVVLFLPAINAGIYHLRYLARATTPGRFVMPATRASCMYDPEIFGQTAAASFEVSREPTPGPNTVKQ